MLVLLVVALWFILRGDLFYVLPCVILFLCFSVLLALRLPRLGKRELILVLFVRLFDLCLFGFVGFFFLLVSGKAAVCDCGTPRTFLLYPFFYILFRHHWNFNFNNFRICEYQLDIFHRFSLKEIFHWFVIIRGNWLIKLLELRMANWEALECVLQVEAVIMPQQHDSLLLILVISKVSHIRQTLGVVSCQLHSL